MANIKEIKQRISSVKKTKKMTSAMKMVAASKYKRALKLLRNRFEYSNELTKIKASLVRSAETLSLPYQMTTNHSDRELLVIFSSDRGLCGGFNTNLLKRVLNYLETQTHPISLLLIGNKAIQFFKSKSYLIQFQQAQLPVTADKDIQNILVNQILNPFQRGELGKVTLVYNRFFNALKSDTEFESFLPVQADTPTESDSSLNTDFYFEPNGSDFLARFLDFYLSAQLYNAILNTITGEEGARMSAMDSASQNATDMISELTLLFNRTRQAAITTELTEIVGGAAALTH